MAIDWSALFGFTQAPAELVVRGTSMYFFLWLLFRVVIRRRIGAIGMADLLVLVIIADAAQNAMAGEYTSVTDGIVLVGTIVAWNYLLDWLAFRFPRLQRWLEPSALLIVDRGRVLWRNMRLELVSQEGAQRQAARKRRARARRGRQGLHRARRADQRPEAQVAPYFLPSARHIAALMRCLALA